MLEPLFALHGIQKQKTGEFAMFEKLLTPIEVARQLGVSRSFAYKLIKTGEIVSVRLGRSVRVLPKDLETYIAQNRSGNQLIQQNIDPKI